MITQERKNTSKNISRKYQKQDSIPKINGIFKIILEKQLADFESCLTTNHKRMVPHQPDYYNNIIWYV